jgi:LCP family protein required for cell wall assembly
MWYFQDSHRAKTQPVYPNWMASKRHRSRFAQFSCALVLLLGLLILLVLSVYLFAPKRTNLMIIGLDYTPEWTATGRTDTIILVSYNPFSPYLRMLSIPRDLWVSIPGIGENRINTAHFFAELHQPGDGPEATLETVHQNFGYDPGYYIRIRFEGFREIVDAIGGLDIVLTQPMAGYMPGHYHLTGNKALAFARHRLGSDDFFRMENGQFLMKSILRQMLHPTQWLRLPQVLVALSRVLETDMPIWHWPRLAITLIRLGPKGIENHTITREMVTPFTTSGGASVLLPNWDRINPLLYLLFSQ